jgi:IS30 family transposase
VHAISFDNGKEFAAHQDIAHALKATIFFATPYHAWERGLNQNTNGLIRNFFPKGTDFSRIAKRRGRQGRAFAQRKTPQIPRLPFTSIGFRLPRLLLNFYALES